VHEENGLADRRRERVAAAQKAPTSHANTPACKCVGLKTSVKEPGANEPPTERQALAENVLLYGHEAAVSQGGPYLPYFPLHGSMILARWLCRRTRPRQCAGCAQAAEGRIGSSSRRATGAVCKVPSTRELARRVWCGQKRATSQLGRPIEWVPSRPARTTASSAVPRASAAIRNSGSVWQPSRTLRES